ncbi:hypothetical protein [Photobacterium sp. J15]|uniref:hypothetical protein n=1 Tax=Photobacterium sp. J15 TaxID=265901 RepID=UPI0007E4D8DF|nr:hypothetical protein [Photobacterium sp. J15]
MAISAFHSGVNMINQSQSMVTSAAKDIQQSTLPSSNPVSQNQRSNPALSSAPSAANSLSSDETITKAATDLLQAKTYNQAGVNVVRRADEMAGTLLDIKV